MTKSLEVFIAEYCDNVNISVWQLRSKSRKRTLVEKRMILAYILRKKVGMTFKDIATCLNRTHASVIHYIKITERFISVYPHIERLYEETNELYLKYKGILIGTPSSTVEKETKLIEILLEKNDKLKTKIIKLEKELYDDKS
jgi:predicted transcriptional regulator